MVDLAERASADEVPEGYGMTELGLLPEDWRVMRLSEIGRQFFGGGTPSSKVPEYWGGDIPWTTSAAISGLRLDRGVRQISATGLSHSSARVVPAGNLLIGTRVGVGKAAINEKDMAISQDLTGMVVDRELADVLFLAYALLSAPIQQRFQLGARGSTIKGIPRDDLIRMPIPLPPLPEQRAIAHVLSTVQRAREATEAVIASTRELKRSLMRHLFTYGPVPVDQVAGVRLKETEIGLVPEQWDVVPLGNLIACGPQNGLYKPHSSYGAGRPIIRIDDFSNEGEVLRHVRHRVELDEAETEKYEVKPNDILINRVNSLSHLGKVALIPNGLESTVFESNMMRFSVASPMLPEYMFRFLTSAAARHHLRGKAKRAVAQSSINQGDVASTPVPVPPPKEQLCIARVLSDTDRKIAAEVDMQDALAKLFTVILGYLLTGSLRGQVTS